MNRRTLLAGAGALLAGNARAVSLRKFGGTLAAGLLEKSPARTLDPHLARTRLERELAAALHVPLFAPARGHFTGRAAGLLVEQAAPTSRERRNFVITLRAGISFSDGSPLTAADVVASLTRSVGAPGGRALAAVLGSIRAKDERRLELETRAPVSDLPALLGGLSASIIPAKSGDAQAGLGGFRVASSSPAEIVLEANPRSPAGRAWLDRLRIVAADDAAFRRGTLQVLASGNAPDREKLSGDVAATIALSLSPKLSADLRARIAAAPDLKVLTEVFLAGRASAASSLLPPALLGVLAKSAAPAAHVRTPRPATKTTLSLFVADASAEIRTVADRIVWDLLEVGIAATIGWKTPESLEEAVASDRYDLALSEWLPCDVDAGRAMAGAARDPLFSAAAGRAEGGTESITAIGLLDDADARTTAALAAAKKITDTGLVVPLVHPRRVLRRSADAGALALDAWGRVDWCEAGR